MGFSRQEHCSGMPLPSPLTYLGRPNIKLYSLSKCEVIISQGSKRIYRKKEAYGSEKPLSNWLILKNHQLSYGVKMIRRNP